MVKLTHVEVRNCFGIEHISFDLGSMTVLEGENEVGKTSILRAVAAALSGATKGKVGSILRDGADEGFVTLRTDDGTEISERAKRKEGGGEKRTKVVKHPTFGSIAAPVEYVEKLVDTLSLNPLRLLLAKEEELLDMVLEVIPIDITDEQLVAAGVPKELLPPPNRNGIDRIAAATKTVYDARTGSNRVAKDKAKAAVQLRESLPPETIARPNLELLRANQRDVAEAKNEALNTVKRETATHRRTVELALEADIQKLRATAQARLDKFAAEEKAQLNDVAERFGKKLEEAAAAIATAEEVERRAGADAGTRALIAQYEREQLAAAAESDARTATLKVLEGMSAAALETFPLETVRIEGGRFLVQDGGGRWTPWPDVNQARKIETILSLLALRAGDLRLACVDGLEALDDSTYGALKAQLSEPGAPLQLLGSRVTNGPLNVDTTAPIAATKEAPAVEHAPFPFQVFKTQAGDTPKPKPTKRPAIF